MPAEVLTARVRAVMQARAATRRGDMARLLGCGCMKTLRSTRQPPVSGCTLSITLRRRMRARSLGGPIVGFRAAELVIQVTRRFFGRREITGEPFPV
ncbi:hypothetical protein GCM10009535_35880 [Streptomyces thermocarboxydovorans]|uniref:Uncharacterized protein n=1 Tax=Streptomyces thermocarboxydovorans TaxID=59298 RepID=A0ABN1HJ88_9ACTN